MEIRLFAGIAPGLAVGEMVQQLCDTLSATNMHFSSLVHRQETNKQESQNDKFPNSRQSNCTGCR